MAGRQTKFNAKLMTDGQSWDKTSLYKTSTLNQNEKNVLAMKNSTDQLLKTKSNNLAACWTTGNSLNKKLQVNDFNVYDQSNHFKTTHQEMEQYSEKPLDYFIPKYGGFVPGMKSENPFGNTFSRTTQEQLTNFENRKCHQEKQESSFIPMSKAIGSYYVNKRVPSQNNDACYDPNLCQSGYSVNLPSKSPAGIICPHFVEPENNKKTEYRSTFNKMPEFHYKGPMYSTGILKQTNSKGLY